MHISSNSNKVILTASIYTSKKCKNREICLHHTNRRLEQSTWQIKTLSDLQINRFLREYAWFMILLQARYTIPDLRKQKDSNLNVIAHHISFPYKNYKTALLCTSNSGHFIPFGATSTCKDKILFFLCSCHPSICWARGLWPIVFNPIDCMCLEWNCFHYRIWAIRALHRLHEQHGSLQLWIGAQLAIQMVPSSEVSHVHTLVSISYNSCCIDIIC